MIEKRLRPAIANKSLKDDDVKALVREAEDFGRQHVFLFEPAPNAPDIASFLKADKIKRFLKAQEWTGLVDSLVFPVMPSDIEAVDVHFDAAHVSVKFVERRSIIVEEKQQLTNGYTVLHVEKVVRAVDVVTLYDSGLLEFRIEAFTGTPNYSHIVDRLWLEVQDLIPQINFREKDLARLRKVLTRKATSGGQKLVRLRVAKGQDSEGIKFGFASSRADGDILNSDSYADGIATLSASRTTRFGHTSVAFLPQKNGNLRREIGVIVTDSINELRVLSRCTDREYQYLRGQFERHSK